MKTIVLLLILSFIAVPVQAALWDPCSDLREDSEELRQNLSDCGQKVVDLGQELSQQEADAKDARNDAIAIGIGVGIVIGGGGLPVIIDAVGGFLGLIF